jgi:squalene-associated FAD-dependent desaturase
MDKTTEQLNYDVIIVGAGLAGIASAVTLSNKGLKVALMEKSPFIGGRAASYVDKTTRLPINLGQHVYMRCCTRFIQLLSRLGQAESVPIQSPLRVPIIDAKTYPKKSSVAWLTGLPVLGPFEMVPAFWRYPFLSYREKLQTLKVLSTIKKTDRDADELRKITFASWLKECHVQESSIDFFWNLLINPMLNGSAREISAHWGLMAFQEAFLKPRASEIGIIQNPMSDLWQPVRTLLSQNGGKLFTRTKVESIQAYEDRVGVKPAGSEWIWAKYVIMAVNHPDFLKITDQIPHLANSDFSPAFGSILDLYLEFSTPVTPPWLKMAGFVYSEIQWLFVHDNRCSINVSISGVDKDKVNLLPDLVLKDLTSWWDCARLEMVRVFHFPKATFLLSPENDLPRPKSVTAYPRVFIAGDWTDTGWPATMEGAVRSGESAANALLIHLVQINR